MHRPRVELATSRSQVRRPTTTPPSHPNPAINDCSAVEISVTHYFVLQIQVQQLQYQLDNVDGELENMSEQKMKNRADLLARQQKTKYYQKVQRY